MKSADHPALLGILLLYYQPYAATAVSQFAAFLRSLDPAACLIVVHNGASPPAHLPQGAHCIPGNNVTREFSGWDAGLRFAREMQLLASVRLAVFANDTFCIHNRFGCITRRVLRRSFTRLLQAPAAPALAGEAYALHAPFSVDGMAAGRWVSTHIFAVSAALLAELGDLSPPGSLERFYTRRGSTVSFSTALSPNMAAHIETWLSGSGRRQWQGVVAQERRSLEHLQPKATSIILEKLTAARAANAGGEIVNSFASPTARLLRRLEFVGMGLKRLSGRLPSRVQHE